MITKILLTIIIGALIWALTPLVTALFIMPFIFVYTIITENRIDNETIEKIAVPLNVAFLLIFTIPTIILIGGI